MSDMTGATKVQLTQADLQTLANNITNTSLIRTRRLITELFDDRRDIDEECGYPKDITASQYRYMYDREGIAQKVVKFWPQETWVKRPRIYETEDPTETAFEFEWEALLKQKNIPLPQAHRYPQRNRTVWGPASGNR